MERQKIVFILGAGCSQEAGVPLVKDFLDVALSLSKPPDTYIKYRQAIHIIGTFRDKYLPQSNVEELFSFIDLQLKIKTADIDNFELNEAKDALNFLIRKWTRPCLQTLGPLCPPICTP